MAMLFLPEETKEAGYNKREILDMLLIHDLAEAEIGDQVLSLDEPSKELKTQNAVLRKLFVKGTYPQIANLTYYYNIWTGYYNGTNINARVARDINTIQTSYTFFEYYLRYPDHFSPTEILAWTKNQDKLNTEIGFKLWGAADTEQCVVPSFLESVKKNLRFPLYIPMSSYGLGM